MKTPIYILLDVKKKPVMAATSVNRVIDYVKAINPLHQGNVTIMSTGHNTTTIVCSWKKDLIESFCGYIVLTELHDSIKHVGVVIDEIKSILQ